MAQHDYVVDNGPGLVVRDDINAVFAAIVSSNLGPLEPVVRYAGMWWLDTSVASGPGVLKFRNQQNDAWLNAPVGIAYLPLAGGTIAGDLTVAGIFSNPDYNAMRGTRAGATAPASPVAGMLWFDTSVSPAVLRARNAANTAWVVTASTIAPVFTDSVTINGSGTFATLNLTASGETRKVYGDSAGNRTIFYGPGDVAQAWFTDAGDLVLPSLGNVGLATKLTEYIRKDSVTVSTAAPSGAPADGAVWYQV